MALTPGRPGRFAWFCFGVLGRARVDKDRLFDNDRGVVSICNVVACTQRKWKGDAWGLPEGWIAAAAAARAAELTQMNVMRTHLAWSVGVSLILSRAIVLVRPDFTYTTVCNVVAEKHSRSAHHSECTFKISTWTLRAAKGQFLLQGHFGRRSCSLSLNVTKL
jgi:hypothetical protein